MRKPISPSDAERWITPDIFAIKDRMYEVTINGKVKRLAKRKINHDEVKQDKGNKE